MNQIIPAILPKSQSELDEKVSSILDLVKFVQVDVCDGKFVSNKTEFSSLPHADEISYELDLMIDVKSPNDLDQYITMKPARIVLHIEAVADPVDCISYLKEKGVEIGLSISNDTPNEFLMKFITDDISFVQLMGIAEIGSQGQPFDERVLAKAEYFKIAHPELTVSVDGSVNENTIGLLSKVGVTRFVCGSSVFSGDPKSNIEKLESLVQ
ncbi:MAG: ribulose-phosphate 3-epimerase, ribulose-phosphate 3-epimerase [Patescibacteria group bacterium]|nr:ribulose-phosphate 3-epimerase, ribulose-phosphate 3-epimerase [Patescibacteria group bacterium]